MKMVVGGRKGGKKARSYTRSNGSPVSSLRNHYVQIHVKYKLILMGEAGTRPI
jgi:hypothetical protein